MYYFFYINRYIISKNDIINYESKAEKKRWNFYLVALCVAVSAGAILKPCLRF